MKYGIIGFGHLGRAMGRGMIDKLGIDPKDILVAVKSAESRAKAENEYGVTVCADYAEVLEQADIIFWVLRKKVFLELGDLSANPHVQNKPQVSFMAGISIAETQSVLGPVHITRAIPNLAMRNCESVTGYTACNSAEVEALFHRLGYAFCVPEEDIEKVSAFASCGIGFAALVMDAFVEAAIGMGFEAEVANKVVEELFISTAHIGDYAATAKAVATPGGATEQGINRLNEAELHRVVAEAMQRSYTKLLNF